MSKRQKTALVVDDDADCRELLMIFLERQGYEGEEVGNAFAARQWLDQNHPDLVTTDFHQGWIMEVKGKRTSRPTGLELLEYLAKRSGDKPSIIVVSGNMTYSPTYAERAKKAGAKGMFPNHYYKKK